MRGVILLFFQQILREKLKEYEQEHPEQIKHVSHVTWDDWNEVTFCMREKKEETGLENE